MGIEKRVNFDPFWILDKPFTQTIIGRFWPQKANPFEAQWHQIDLGTAANPSLPNDRLLVALHVQDSLTLARANKDSLIPVHSNPKWVVLFHGLTGCSESRYILRLTHKLYKLGYNIMRVNFRNAGQSLGYSSELHHAGRSDDIAASIAWLEKMVTNELYYHPDGTRIHSFSDIELNLVGFSLGGSTLLRYVAELEERGLYHALPLNKILVLSSPFDLFSASEHINKPENAFFNRYFRYGLIKDTLAWNNLTHRLDEGMAKGQIDFDSVETVYDYDDMVIAPLYGFKDARTYYDESSACNQFEKIKKQCHVLHAIDDPIVDNSEFYGMNHPYIDLTLTQKGGHLGYIGRPGAPLRFMDHWIVTKITED